MYTRAPNKSPGTEVFHFCEEKNLLSKPLLKRNTDIHTLLECMRLY